MFSPIFATKARRCSSSVEPLWVSLSRSSKLDGAAFSAAAATALAKAWNSSLLATKSVSQFTSTSAAVLPERSIATVPSAATRAAFLSAFARPLLRMSSAAASRSPLVSTSAFLHSIMPAPVRSRSCFTASAVMFMKRLSLLVAGLGRSAAATLAARRARGGPPRDRRRRRHGAGGQLHIGDILALELILLHRRHLDR